MSGYEVVPGALTDMANLLVESTNTWLDLRAGMTTWTMESFTLGVLGEMQGYPAGYNEILAEVISKVDLAAESFVATEQALRAVAADYEAQEAEFYEQFGYVEEELGGGAG